MSLDPEPCRIFVAAYTQTHAMIVFAEPESVHEEIGLMGPLVADVMGGQEPPSDGLWMFDGTVRDTQSSENDPSECKHQLAVTEDELVKINEFILASRICSEGGKTAMLKEIGIVASNSYARLKPFTK